ncbi:AAA family ATPase [Leekyejoonella antrihumi]|uniref:ATPase n=1 Tax=Leekyejoonella antrihumi TaxID=1660198 RepID=A0A563E972_9MICO|nr:AAA family ATPase [Leekyejoonella antrihumi]TWP39066.1 ATPase [Leekyejoonella antrihumi]
MLTHYVLTGAPGSGKTSVLHELRRRGHAVVEEAATDVIAERQALGIDEPWARDDFVDLIVMLQRERASMRVCNSVHVQIHDRSPLCTLALARYLGRPVTPLLAGEVSRVLSEQVYARSVLLVRPLGFIEPTAARRISYAESLAFERVHEDVYRENGFDLVDIPPGPVADRADLAEAHILAATERLRHR